MMPPLETLIYFFIVLIVVIGLTVFILRNIQIDNTIKNIVLGVEGLIFLLWFLRLAGIV